MKVAELVYRYETSDTQWKRYVTLAMKIHNNNLPCKANVISKYARASAKEADILLFVWNATSQRRLSLQDLKKNFDYKGVEWWGAVSIELKKIPRLGNVFYIDNICMANRGRATMKLIEHYLRDSVPSIRYITLSSLLEVMGFYRKCGFVFGSTGVESKRVTQAWDKYMEGKRFADEEFDRDEDIMPEGVRKFMLELNAAKVIHIPKTKPDIIWEHFESGVPMIKKVK